ncbi:hypothetical protein ACHAW6_001348 [Cyclotella cf. meneghiniana]
MPPVSYYQTEGAPPPQGLYRDYSERTADFLNTKHDPKVLQQICKIEVPIYELDDEERDHFYYVRNHTNAAGRGQYHSLDPARYEADEDPTLSDVISGSCIVITILFLGFCGYLGYCVLWFFG